MPVELRFRGLEDFAKVAKTLEASGKDTRRRLQKALERSTPEAKDAVREAASSTLPQRGGLAAHVAALKFRTVSRVNGTGASVKLKGWTEGGAHKAARREKARQRAADRRAERKAAAAEHAAES